MSTPARDADSPVDAARGAAALQVRQRRMRHFGVGFTLIWLAWLTWPVVNLVTSGKPPWVLVLGLALTAAFVSLYTAGVVNDFGRCQRPIAAAVTVGLVAIPVGLQPLIGVDSAAYLIFTGCFAVFAWPVWISLPAIGVFTAWAALLPVVAGASPQGWFFAVLIAGIGLLMYAVRRMQAQGEEIERAHERLAELAVADERARFGRDVHDLLGHSLTSIIVKAELAGKLVDRDPARLSDEIADIERLAREGLEDVRRTAAGYREVTLSAELVSARSALASAGIRAELPQAVDQVPGRLRELFGWAVREGVTNVIRHSGARRCDVRLTSYSVEVLDDGEAGTNEAGNGLCGLADRAASVGACVEAKPRPSGGFRLSVRVDEPGPNGGGPAVSSSTTGRYAEATR